MKQLSLRTFGALALTMAACPGDDSSTTDTTGADSTSTSTSTSGGPVTITITGVDSTSSTGGPTTTGLDTSTGTTVAGMTDSSTTAGATSTGELCMLPEEDCGGVCVDISMSDEHCGMCDDPCVMGDVCAMSLCNGARELVVNGDFAGGTTDWTTQNNPNQVATCMGAPDDESFVFVDGGGFITNAPGSMGPSSHVFYQDFTVPAGVTTAAFSMDYAQDPAMPLDPINVQTIIKDCLDENMDGLEQNAFRIDIVDPADDVFLAPILFEVATPDMAAGDPSAGPPPMLVNVANADPALLAFLQGEEGNMLRLRIAQVESTFPWTIAFDDVSLAVDVAY